MIDITYKKFKDFEKLGYSSLCIVDKDCVICNDLKKARKLKNKFDLVLYNGSKTRPALESKFIDIIFGIEDHNQRDFLHQRNSGLNHIMCKIAHDKDKIICFDFSMIQNNKGIKRSKIIGRIKQNIKLCQKYNVKMAVASFAKQKSNLKHTKDLQSLFFILGIKHPKKLFFNIEEKLKENIFKKTDDYIAKGIQIKS